MNCKEINKNLIFYIEGVLSSEKKLLVEEHLAKCEKCKQLFTEIKKTYDVINNENKVDVNPFFYTRVKAKMEDVNESSVNTIFRPSFIKILQTSVAVVLIAVAVYTGIMMGDNFINTSMASVNQQAYSEYQEYSQEVFLDGLAIESIETTLLKEEE